MKNQGFTALISVLIISALILTISIGLSLRSIEEIKMASNQDLSNKALSLTEACAENAVLKLKQNQSYSGNEDVIIEGNDSCHIFPVEGSGNFNRVIKTESTVKELKRKIRIDISQVSPLQIFSWQEVSDF